MLAPKDKPIENPRFPIDLPFMYGNRKDLNCNHEEFVPLPLSPRTRQMKCDELPCQARGVCSYACGSSDFETIDVLPFDNFDTDVLVKCPCDFYFRCKSINGNKQWMSRISPVASYLGHINLEAQYGIAKWIQDLHISIYGKMPNGEPLFEYGAAAGTLLGLLRGIGFDVRGLEVWKPWRDFAVKAWNLDIKNVNISEVAPIFGKSHFNVVLGFQTAEHFELHDKDLNYLYEILKPNGMFIACVPNVASSEAVDLAKEGKEWWKHIEYIKNDLHRSMWTRKSLAITLSLVGYKKIYTGVRGTGGWELCAVAIK